MSTKLIAWVVIGLVVVGGGWYAFSQKGDSTAMSDDGSMQNSTADTEVAGTFNGSLADLSARGGSWRCTVDTSAMTGAGAMQASGVVYVSGQKVRANFDVEAPVVGTVHTYMIADGTDVYSWSSMMPTGIKAPMQKPVQQHTAPTTDTQTGPYNNYSYDCQPTTVDTSLFTVPSTITFQAVAQ